LTLRTGIADAGHVLGDECIASGNSGQRRPGDQGSRELQNNLEAR